MVFNPQNIIKSGGSFVFWGGAEAIAHPCLNKPIIKEFWQNFTFQSSALGILEREEYIFSVGSAEGLALDGNAYSINITEDGICVCAKGERELLLGFMALLDRIRAKDTESGLACELECCQIKDSPLVRERMVHFCVFPETELWELRRFVRFCGALRYTHVIFEFWGMLKYDCMSELSWSHAFNKEQIIPIVREANDLGLEVIPMFNHWGHASAGRVMHGKHVVLDQDPTLQSYFSDDGWCWDISSPKVRALLRQVRGELCELCGEGRYFHIGCDEAYGFSFTKENMDLICDFINGISDEMALLGRRVIVWGDMFLYRHSHYDQRNAYVCNSESPETERYLLSRLDKRVVVADWQYDSPHAPVETASVITHAGFSCLLCPWDRGARQLSAVLSTVKEQGLDGIIHTTWHTLSGGMPYVAMAAAECFEQSVDYGDERLRKETAQLLRKVMPACGDYRRAGWSRYQVNFQW